MSEDTLSNRQRYIELYDKLSSKIYRIAMLYTQDTELAKDILQEIFITLWNNKSLLSLEADAVEAYLFQCTRNKAIDLVRKNKRQHSYLQSISSDRNISSGSHDTEDTVSLHILQTEIAEIVERLPNKCREVYQLSRMENLDNKTIAFKLNISEKTVKNHLTRALDRLRSQLKYKM